MLEAQAKLREGTVVLQPLKSADKVYEQEFVKGEAAGLRMALALPKQVIDACRAELIEKGVIQDVDPETVS